MKEVGHCTVRWRVDYATKTYIERMAGSLEDVGADSATAGAALRLIVRGFRVASQDERCREIIRAALSPEEGSEAISANEALSYGLTIVGKPGKGRVRMERPDGSSYDPDGAKG